jgi:uncharacterized protein (DUF3084 family)
MATVLKVDPRAAVLAQEIKRRSDEIVKKERELNIRENAVIDRESRVKYREDNVIRREKIIYGKSNV